MSFSFPELYGAVYAGEKVYLNDELWRIAVQGSASDLLEALVLTIPVASHYRDVRNHIARKYAALSGQETAFRALRGLQVEDAFSHPEE